MICSLDEGATWSKLQSPYDSSYFGALPVGDKGALVFGLHGSHFAVEDAQGFLQKSDIQPFCRSLLDQLLNLGRRLIESYVGLFHTVDHVEGILMPGLQPVSSFSM